MENNKTLLDEEIKSEFEKLRRLEIGTDKYKTTVDGLTKLYDRSIEIKKFNAEREDKRTEREDKRKAAEEDRLDRWVKHGLTVAGIVIPTVVTVWGTLVSINFEKEGTFTTIMGRGYINKLLPKK